VNRIQPQGLKGRLVLAFYQPEKPARMDFKTTRMKSRATHQFLVVVIQTSSPAFNINRSPEVSLLSIDFYYCLVNCDGTLFRRKGFKAETTQLIMVSLSSSFF